jgi:hypothetical protein
MGYTTQFTPQVSFLDFVRPRVLIIFSEEQAVAGRWRALTRQSIQRAGPDTAEILSRRIINSLSDILLCAGLSDEREKAERMVMDGVGSNLSLVTELAQKLNKVIGEEITSCDLRVTKGREVSPTENESCTEGGGGSVAGGKSIICTTELGLSKRVKTEGKQEETILLQPAVELEGFLDSD